MNEAGTDGLTSEQRRQLKRHAILTRRDRDPFSWKNRPITPFWTCMESPEPDTVPIKTKTTETEANNARIEAIERENLALKRAVRDLKNQTRSLSNQLCNKQAVESYKKKPVTKYIGGIGGADG